jgi:hypothetical protein
MLSVDMLSVDMLFKEGDALPSGGFRRAVEPFADSAYPSRRGDTSVAIPVESLFGTSLAQLNESGRNGSEAPGHGAVAPLGAVMSRPLTAPRAPLPAPPPPPAPAEWFYKDTAGIVQGPFRGPQRPSQNHPPRLSRLRASRLLHTHTLA